MNRTQREIDATIERVTRESYGRLLAFVAARGRDVSTADDALSDAFCRALETWPRDGVPQNPEAWLLAVARNKLVDVQRRERLDVERRLPLDENTLAAIGEATQRASPNRHGEATMFPDERLKLLFACAHPAIDAAVRTPLMLQTILGLDAERIAAAFLVPAATMSQRLVRAKSKIRAANIPIETPTPSQLPERLDAVLDAIYVAYSCAWDASADDADGDLRTEALWLARMLVDLLPHEPEPRGLLALLLHIEARRSARIVDGRYIPLGEQDASRWNRDATDEAESHLRTAHEFARPGRYQYEAAIQSVHAARRHTRQTDWPAVINLYEALIAVSPRRGATLAYIAAIAEGRSAHDARLLLDDLPLDGMERYQPYWAVRARVYALLGNPAVAVAAYDRAIQLSTDKAAASFLLEQREAGI